MSTVVRTMCPMNCHPTLCGMLVEIEDGRVLSVKGDPDNPDSQGFLCVRGQAAKEIIGNAARLLYPMVRDRRGGGDWRRVGWDEVLDRIDRTMLVVTHDLPFAAQLCERAVILSQGRIVADGPCARTRTAITTWITCPPGR